LTAWRLLLSAAVAACLAPLAGCGPSDVGVISPEEEKALIEEANTASPNLQPGEKIKVTVFGEDRLTGEYQIDPGGYVSLPLAGTIRAAGLSKQQLEQSLMDKFRSGYLRDPKVTVDVADFRPFYILGEVAKPGEYPFKGRLDILSAIALAGGSTYRASRSNILIKHASETQFKEYPLSPSIPVLPGDLIQVPQRYF
jgi:protein involved in polysaccharide export with SLBB domain